MRAEQAIITGSDSQAQGAQQRGTLRLNYVTVIERLRRLEAEGNHLADAIAIGLARLSDIVTEGEELRRLFGKRP